jgi:hypothetical protein
MTISGGSALSKEEIERMVKEAEAHAEEDKKRARRSRPATCRAARLLDREVPRRQSGDKVSAELRAGRRGPRRPQGGHRQGLHRLEDDIKAKTTTSHEVPRMGQAMYAAAAAGRAPSGDGPGADPDGASRHPTRDDDVVDAEVVDDDGHRVTPEHVTGAPRPGPDRRQQPAEPGGLTTTPVNTEWVNDGEEVAPAPSRGRPGCRRPARVRRLPRHPPTGWLPWAPTRTRSSPPSGSKTCSGSRPSTSTTRSGSTATGR